MDSYAIHFFISYVWRYTAISDLMINEQIRDKEVRVIGENNEQLGIMSAKEALRLAEEAELDLVKIAPQAKPPVCRMMDYGKFRFEQLKKEKEARKRQHVVETKEIRLSPNIDVHDIDFKTKNARRFLSEGNKVKDSVRFRGREMAHTELGEDLLRRFAEACNDISMIDKPPKMEGRSMVMFISATKS